MKPNYLPLEDRVVVFVPKDEERTTNFGLIVPVDANALPLKEVVVVAVGDGVKSNGQEVAMFVKPEQKVVIGRRTGVEYDMDGKTYRIIRQDDIQFLIQD